MSRHGQPAPLADDDARTVSLGFQPAASAPGGPFGPHPSAPHVVGPQQRSNGLGTAGFVTALVGAVLALVPLVGIVSRVICPVGLVLSVVGFVLASQRGGAGRGLSVTGIVLAVVGLIACSIYAVSFANAVSSIPSYRSSSPSYTAPSYVPSSAPAAAAVPGQFTSGTYEVGTFTAR